jgi:methenyltetrahydrofolate cyclohydrolase
MYADKSISAFLEELASKAPTPGGGSAAAFMGAVGAGLASMVCNLTIGNEKYRDAEERLRELLSQTEELRRDLMELMERDMVAYGKVSAAMKMPRATQEEKDARTAALQASLKDACEAPLAIMGACAEVLHLCHTTAELGTPHAVSDVGVAVHAARAGLVGAEMNVAVNVGLLKDQEYAESVRMRADAVLAQGAEDADAALTAVKERR